MFFPLQDDKLTQTRNELAQIIRKLGAPGVPKERRGHSPE